MSANSFLNWGWDVTTTPPHQLRRVRSLAFASLALILVGLPFLARSIQWGLSLRIILLGSAICLALLALGLLRRGWFRPSVHCMALGVYLGGVNQCVTVGGMVESGAVAWWLIVALIGGLLGGVRTGVFWAGFSMVTGLTLFYFESRGYHFPNLTPPHARGIQQVMMLVGEFAALVAVMVAYLTQIETSERNLEQKNEDLQQQVQRAEQAEAEALDANAAKSRFLANMTHELRTPLNSILGFNHRVMNQLQGKIEPRQLDALKIVDENGEQMLRLVTDLLDLSHLDAGKLEFSRGLIDLREMVSVLVPRLRLHAHRHNLELLVEPLPEAFTRGDVSQIKRTIETVVGHGLQYCPEHSVVVCAEVNEENFWVLQVQCKKLVFEPDHLQRIFDRFHHLHSVSGRPVIVSGLAMVLAREFAELHGGGLQVHSDADRGTLYNLTLPIS